MAKKKNKERKQNSMKNASHLEAVSNNKTLSDFYNYTLVKIAAKNVIRLDPEVKHSICKYCNSLLVPGNSTTIRVKSNRETHVVLKCTNCESLRRFQTKKKKNESTVNV